VCGEIVMLETRGEMMKENMSLPALFTHNTFSHTPAAHTSSAAPPFVVFGSPSVHKHRA
jgi:hypothetical protein